MTETTVPAGTDVEAAPKSAETEAPLTREESRYLTPPVDIHESEDGLAVVVDLPGVEKDDVELKVEKGILTIEGKTSYSLPEDLNYGEFKLVNFFRQFRLSDEVDSERISADLRHGVLTVQLPKSPETKPKRVLVKVQD